MNSFLDYKLLDTDKFALSISDLISCAFIVFLTWVIVKLGERYFRRRVKEGRMDTSNAYALSRIVQYVIWIVGILFALESIGIKMSIVLAGSAALLVGIGLGLQQIFKDLVSGIFILFERKIRIGDMLQVNHTMGGTSGIRGTIQKIGIRTSELETADNIFLIIPNSILISDPIVNWSHVDLDHDGYRDAEILTRTSVTVGVDYTSDVEQVKNLLLQCAEEHPHVSTLKSPFVRFTNFGDSSLDFELFFWYSQPLVGDDVKSDLRFAIKKIFKEKNINIPFPQRVVTMQNADLSQISHP
ncbi:MAG: mechanosensitive ion channel [Bacteroidales bacterium]